MSSPSDLLGRDAELRRLDALLDRAADGRSAAALLVGEPGIGKSALLRAVAGRCRARQGTVLTARGVEAESDLPFAGLHELLRPTLPFLTALGDPHRTALEVALGRTTGPPPTPFAVGVALLAMLEVEPDRGGPLLLAVDDAQWLDAGSLQALRFAARRLDHEGALVLLAARPEAGRELDDGQAERIDLGPLDRGSAVALARRAGAAEERIDRVLALAAGLPLALVELARASGEALAAPSTAGWRPSRAIERAFRDELTAVGPAAARGLVLLALEERATRAELAVAAATLGGGSGDDGLAEAVDRGLLVPEGHGLRFRHPLLRAVVLHDTSAEERRAAHLALAAALPVDRSAWHRAGAAQGPDPALADALMDAAVVARQRGDLSAAARDAAAAVRLADDPARAATHALAAAEMALQVGALADARDLTERALVDPPADALVRADLERVRGTAMGRMGLATAGTSSLLRQVEVVADRDPGRAATLLLSATPTYWFTGDADAFAETLDRVDALSADRLPVHRALSALLRTLLAASIGGTDGALEELDRHLPALEGRELPPTGYEPLASPAHASLWCGGTELADVLLERQLSGSRRIGAVSELVYPLTVLGQLELRRGAHAPALAAGSEALQLARDTEQDLLAGLAAALLAQTEATLGREEPCRAHAQFALEQAERSGAVLTTLQAHTALGRIELAVGRPEDALVPLRLCATTAARTGFAQPNMARWGVDLVEALVRAGARGEAEAAHAQLEARVARSPTPWGRAAVERTHALLTPGPAGEASLVRAIARLDAAGDALEAALARLALGERLRRERRRREARAPLQLALERLERAGAGPWAERAREELRATGGPTGERRSGPADELSPHELRISLLVADGRTNPEIAAELFVSRKTVEHHLSQIYRKLGLRSRTELARALVEPGARGGA
ncbi:LuxR family transcriptional regulator [Patulibacter brassicae]|uniref:LuxR family transcriptional regulator n=1 Tax=Patulibacter brassicae TaxID=1705717 RepID=A0ABU4VLF3_9ACTN|nr:LuxR family transcriptional regulator [Patulibacter brassicae]MDX8152653.1 LuxR family transcriptional regulator [Patulibacter brassicae]